MALHDMMGSHDVLLHSLSFLPLNNLPNFNRSCHYFNELLKGKDADKIIFKYKIVQPFIGKRKISSELDEFLKRENCKELMKEFFQVTFYKVQLNDSFLDSLSMKGGEAKTTAYEPCKLLKALFKNGVQEDVKRSIHKFLLLLHSAFPLKFNMRFLIGRSKYCEYFSEERKRIDLSSVKFTNCSMGKLLFHIISDFRIFKTSSTDYHPIVITIPDTFELDTFEHVIIYAPIIRNAIPLKEWQNVYKCTGIFGFWGDASKELKEIKKHYYNNNDGSCEHYNWYNFLKNTQDETWALKWAEGNLYGGQALTSYDTKKERLLLFHSLGLEQDQ